MAHTEYMGKKGTDPEEKQIACQQIAFPAHPPFVTQSRFQGSQHPDSLLT